jgi:hypothetical protein
LLANALNRFICDAGAGCKAWTTTTGICTSPANLGTVTAVTNGVTINFGDVGAASSNSVVYGHPQACVYSMALSDSCEVHAGTYNKPGAFCSENCDIGDTSTEGICNRSDCWKAFVVALGIGPNLTGTGRYGTSSNPAYLRGAVMNGSIDTWDTNRNKRPDSDEGITSYPAVFDGDLDNDNVFDNNVDGNDLDWNTATVGGDAFYGLILGCGDGPNSYNKLCRVSKTEDDDWIKIDHDGDGTMDLNYGVMVSPYSNTNYPNTDHFIIQDIEMHSLNGGTTAASGNGIRMLHGNITMMGNTSSDGLKANYLYIHDNDYSNSSVPPSGGAGENQWAVFADQENSGCAQSWEIAYNLVYQNNENVFNDDCGSSECGCGMNIHDNRIIVDVVASSKNAGRTIHMGYWKAIDTVQGGARKKAFRFWNNEVVFLRLSNQYLFHDLQSFGNQTNNGLGEFWIYGNVFRMDPTMSVGGSSMRLELSFNAGEINGSGNPKDSSWRYYLFNNTYDWSKEMEAVSNNDSSGELLVERNNAYFRTTSVHAHTNAGVTKNRASEVCSVAATACTTASSIRTVWFTPGAFSSGNPSLWTGLTNYSPAVGGPLLNTGTCDPDGDGAPGYKATDGVTNITSWTDLAGNPASCPTVGSVISIGALQPAVVPPAVCGNGAVEVGETCDDGSQAVNACVYGDTPPLQQVCNGTCTGTTDCASPQYCGDSTVQVAFEQCDGALLNGHTCSEFGVCTGTPTCVSCVISSAGCNCASINPDLIGVDIFGVSINP